MSFHIAQEHFLWWDFPTGIKIFVLVTLAIFGIYHYRGHFCFKNTYCLNFTFGEKMHVPYRQHPCMTFWWAIGLQKLNPQTPLPFWIACVPVLMIKQNSVLWETGSFCERENFAMQSFYLIIKYFIKMSIANLCLWFSLKIQSAEYLEILSLNFNKFQQSWKFHSRLEL